MTLKDRVQQRLDELKLSGRRAALKAGLGERYVNDILDGSKRSLTGEKGKALADVLETTLEWLVEGRNPEHNNSIAPNVLIPNFEFWPEDTKDLLQGALLRVAACPSKQRDAACRGFVAFLDGMGVPDLTDDKPGAHERTAIKAEIHEFSDGLMDMSDEQIRAFLRSIAPLRHIIRSTGDTSIPKSRVD